MKLAQQPSRKSYIKYTCSSTKQTIKNVNYDDTFYLLKMLFLLIYQTFTVISQIFCGGNIADRIESESEIFFFMCETSFQQPKNRNPKRISNQSRIFYIFRTTNRKNEILPSANRIESF